jgi:hypothetical protein
MRCEGRPAVDGIEIDRAASAMDRRPRFQTGRGMTKADSTEVKCDACNGTGLLAEGAGAWPQIYLGRRAKCRGKGG